MLVANINTKKKKKKKKKPLKHQRRLGLVSKIDASDWASAGLVQLKIQLLRQNSP